MWVKYSPKTPEQFQGDLLVYLVRQESGKKAPGCLNHKVQAIVERAFRCKDFSGKEEEILLAYPETGPGETAMASRILVVGLGKEPLQRELFRRVGGTIAVTALKTKAKKILVAVPEDLDFSIQEMSECLSEGLLLGSYQFTKHKNFKKKEEEPAQLTGVNLAGGDGKAIRQGIERGSNAAAAVLTARDMANEPGNFWTANHFVEQGKQLAAQYKLGLKVLLQEELQALGMNGLLSVNQGSKEPPALLILEYRTGKKVPTVLLVGKGLTFDSGGISLKPSSNMHDMKYDMCGGAAVLAAVQAVAAEGLTGVDVVAIVPSTDNMPGLGALKPGDVISQYNGKTVEIISTDAEGRLILADALAYGIEQYQPAAVIDIATLTGAVIASLGHHRTGLLSNDDSLAAKLSAAGERSGELLWRLPLDKEYGKQLESQVADLKNVGDKGGGTITAAAFLQEFVGECPWAHLDIAGTAWDCTPRSYITKGASGVGVRTLLELLRAWK